MRGAAGQVVRTDPTNILIRSLQRNAKKDKPAGARPARPRAAAAEPTAQPPRQTNALKRAKPPDEESDGDGKAEQAALRRPKRGGV